MTEQPADDTVVEEPETAAADELAFDVDDLPGGALAALEAVLMVADEPIAAVRLATVLALPTARVEALLDDAGRRVPR